MESIIQQIDSLRDNLDSMAWEDIRPAIVSLFAGVSASDAKAIVSHYFPRVRFRSGREAVSTLATMLEETKFTLIRCNF